MKNTARQRRIALSLIFIFLLTITGCRGSEEIKPAANDIRNVSSAAGFLAGCVEESGGFIASVDESKGGPSDHAYIYDNAMALIALSEAGAVWHVQKLADVLVFAQDHDRLFKDGRFRNAYTSGDPRSDSGRSITGGKVTIRLPGFWQSGRWQEDYYTVSTSTGNMACSILALCKAAENASVDKKTEYLDAAVRAADFVLTLKSSTGGFTAGYEGWDNDQIKVDYKSTEHNIDLIRAFNVMAGAIKESDPTKAAVYFEASDHAKSFVLSMYDDKFHCFYTGTEKDGKTISKGVIPLDSNSLAILALREELFNAHKIISFVEDRMSIGAGFDFSAGDLDGIWNEGTAQMALCYSELGESEKYDSKILYLKTQEARDGSIPAADRDGVSTGFYVSGSKVLWEYHNQQSISATSWYALAQMKANPFGK